MTSKEIHDSLDAMLINPKARNFLNHLVRAYFPISRVDKVWEKSDGSLKCVLSRDSLVTVEDVLVGVESDEAKNSFYDFLKTLLDDKVEGINPFSANMKGKDLALKGTTTTTYMSFPALREFYTWVMNKSLQKDKHVNWLLGSIRKTLPVDKTKHKANSEVKKREEPKSMVSTYKLGEVPFLKDLMSKLKEE